MKLKSLLVLCMSIITFASLGQNPDVKIGPSFHLNLQRQNNDGDAFILHNAKWSSGNTLAWENTHTGGFGSRGIVFRYLDGIHFFASSGNTSQNSTFTPVTRFFVGNNGNVGIGTTNPAKALEVIGDISLPNSSGSKSIFTWAPNDNNWRIGMSTNSGFERSLATSHVQFITYYSNSNEGFAIGVNGGQSSFEVKGANHTAFFRGNVGIGTSSPDAKLTVKGVIHSQEIKVDLLGAVAPDYVFEEDYKLLSLSEIEKYLKANKHLPEVPSAKEMETNGVNLKEMNMLLLKKVEELTLHLIEMKKEIDTLRADQSDSTK